MLEQVQIKATKVIKDLEHNYLKGSFVRWGSVSSAMSSVKEHEGEALSCARGRFRLDIKNKIFTERVVWH